MNEDLQFFLAVLALFYLYDAIYWVRPGGLLFRSYLGEPHQLLGLFRHALLQNDHGGFLLANLLPLGSSAQAQYWPVSLSPQGVLAHVSQSLTPEGRPDQPGLFFRYDDIHTVKAEGHQVRINERKFVTVCSPELARRLAQLIEKLCALPEDRREAEIDTALAQATNFEEITTRFRRAWWDSLLLMLLCTLTMAYVFVFVPVSIDVGLKLPLQDFLGQAFALDRTTSGLLAYIVYFLFLSLLVMLEYVRLAGSIPGHEGSLTGQALLVLLFPPSTMHARNHLFRQLLAPYHPLVIARALCERDTFREFAEHVVRDLEYPLEPVCPNPEEGAIATEAWFRAKLAARLRTVVEEAGISVAACLQPPPRVGPTCLCYCPRCQTQFEMVTGLCHLCNDRPLVPLPEHVEQVPVPLPVPVVEKKPEPVRVPVPAPAERKQPEKRRRGKKRKKR
jgi:hypothetical protein